MHDARMALRGKYDLSATAQAVTIAVHAFPESAGARP